MKFRIGLVYTPMIFVLTLGCSDSGPATPAGEPVKVEAKAPEVVKKGRRVKEPTKQLGPEGVVD